MSARIPLKTCEGTLEILKWQGKRTKNSLRGKPKRRRKRIDPNV